MGRSRFTRSPGRRSPKFVRRRVSSSRSNCSLDCTISVTVRQQPFTARLTPEASFWENGAAISSPNPPSSFFFNASTFPVASTIPVNIDDTLYTLLRSLSFFPYILRLAEFGGTYPAHGNSSDYWYRVRRINGC